MSIFKKKEEETTRNVKYKCSEVYVLTTTITSSSDKNDNNYCGPMCITWYFLATKQEDKYYELFSDINIMEEKDTHANGIVEKEFDRPYITEIEPLRKYMMDKKAKKIKKQILFDFITMMNVDNVLNN